MATEPADRSVPESLASAAGSTAAAVLVSRLLGVVREMVLARYFGAGFATDAYNIAYRIPNLLRDLFAEGALSAAFVPTFIRRLTERGKEEAWRLASRVQSALIVLLGGLTLLFFVGAKGFVYMLASGYAADPKKLFLTVELTRILSPFLFWIALAAVLMGMLNACGSFFVPAMASSAFNFCCILAGIFLSPLMPRWGLHPVTSMAVGALAGGISQFGVMVPAIRRYGFRFRFELDFSDPGLRHIARLMIPSVIGLSATQIHIAVDSQLASHYGNGPVSWLNYGFRLMQFPMGLFGIAVATASMAAVSRYAAKNDSSRLLASVDSSLRLAACLTFPATVGLVLFRHEIVQLLFERGSFVASDTLKTSQVVALYALGLFSLSAVKILAPAFYALDDSRTPVRMTLAAVGAKITLNFLLAAGMGFAGLALATTAASWLHAALLWRRLRRRLGGARGRGEFGVYLRIAAASAGMGIAGLAVLHVLGRLVPGPALPLAAARLFVTILFCILAWLPLLQALGVDETGHLRRTLRSLAAGVL